MHDVPSDSLVYLFIGVQLLGFCTAWLARLSIGQRFQGLTQAVFFLIFCVVGLSAMQAFQFGATYWLASGFTLCAMTLIAICDFSHHRRVTVF